MKLVKNILKWTLILIVGFFVFLFGSIAVDGLLGGGRLDAVTNTTIPGLNGGPDVRAYVAKPDGEGPFPTVIMIHEFFGLNQSIGSKAELLAEQGYFVIAPDTFRGSTTAWIPRAIYQVITTKQEETDMFVLVYDPAASGANCLTFSTYYGGEKSEYPLSIAAGPNGRLAVGGFAKPGDQGP